MLLPVFQFMKPLADTTPQVRPERRHCSHAAARPPDACVRRRGRQWFELTGKDGNASKKHGDIQLHIGIKPQAAGPNASWEVLGDMSKLNINHGSGRITDPSHAAHPLTLWYERTREKTAALGGERATHSFEDAEVTPANLKDSMGFLMIDGTVDQTRRRAAHTAAHTAPDRARRRHVCAHPSPPRTQSAGQPRQRGHVRLGPVLCRESRHQQLSLAHRPPLAPPRVERAHRLVRACYGVSHDKRALNPETAGDRLHRVVRQSTLNFLVKFSVYDYDALTANDLVATTAIKLSELVTPTTQTNRALPLQLTKQVCPAEELGRHAAGAGI